MVLPQRGHQPLPRRSPQVVRRPQPVVPASAVHRPELDAAKSQPHQAHGQQPRGPRQDNRFASGGHQQGGQRRGGGGGRGRRRNDYSGPKPAISRGVSARTVEAVLADKQAHPTAAPLNVVGNPPKLKVYALGGLEEVGRNCTVFECGDDIVIIDAGLQFPEESTPGIDFIVPNVAGLKGKEKNIRGIIVTHGHLDHIGGLPYILPKIGWPVIYTAPLTAGLIRKRQEEFHNANQLKIQAVTGKTRIQLGRNFVFEPFHVNHNISDAFGTALYTPYGAILNTGDFKFDFTPADGDPADLIHIASFGAKRVLMLMSDSTNAHLPGHQISEKTIGQELATQIERAPGRIIISTFSSMLTRIQQIIEIAERVGRKVLLQGRSIINQVEIAHKLGYLKYKPGSVIEESEWQRLPNNKKIVICTGAQGESNASLMRIANKEHRFIFIEPGDTVLFSSSVVPGNERSVEVVKDILVRQGAKLVDRAMVDIHAGGHAKQEDLKLMIRLTKPQYFMPIHGRRFVLEIHAGLAEDVGIPHANCLVADNGQVIEFDKRGGRLTTEYVPTDYVMIDGLGIGDVSEVVLRDRRELSADGMVVVVCNINHQTGGLIKDPTLITRGFVHVKEMPEVVAQAGNFVKKLIKDHGGKNPAQDEFLRDKIRNELGAYLFKMTERRPMILPVILEV